MWVSTFSRKAVAATSAGTLFPQHGAGSRLVPGAVFKDDVPPCIASFTLIYTALTCHFAA